MSCSENVNHNLYDEQDWNDLISYLERMLPTYLNLQQADIDDAVSYTLAKYLDLTRSQKKEDLTLAQRIASSREIKYGWARHRAIDFVRSIQRRVSIETTLEPELIVASGLGNNLETSDLYIKFLMNGSKVVRQLGPGYGNILEILLDSAMSGIPEGALAIERGISPQTFTFKKKRLQKAMRTFFKLESG